jgi:hypothetical protein
MGGGALRCLWLAVMGKIVKEEKETFYRVFCLKNRGMSDLGLFYLKKITKRVKYY